MSEIQPGSMGLGGEGQGVSNVLLGVRQSLYWTAPLSCRVAVTQQRPLLVTACRGGWTWAVSEQASI